MLSSYIEFDVLTHKLQNSLVNLAYIHYPTITRVAIKTGLDRRLVGDIINHKRPKLIDNVLKKIIKEIQYQANNGSDILKKHGQYNSITTMISFAANGATSSNPVTKELIQRGYLKDLGHRVQYKNPAPNLKLCKNLQVFSLKFNILVDELIDNNE
jgi:hypothetical protein